MRGRAAIDDDPDPIIAEMRATQRDRKIIVIATVIGILAGAACGIGYALGGLGRHAWGAGGPGNPAALIFFVAPLAVCMALGYGLHEIVRRTRR